MNELAKFAAKVQAWMALLLIGSVAFVTFLLIGITAVLIFMKLGVDQSLVSLLNTVTNALINMGAIGVGFWLARHRPQTQDGADNGGPQPAPLAQQQPEKHP